MDGAGETNTSIVDRNENAVQQQQQQQLEQDNNEENPGFLLALVLSITRGGIPSQLVTFVTGTLILLILLIALMLFSGASKSIHIYIFLGLAVGLLVSLHWFLSQLGPVDTKQLSNTVSDNIKHKPE